VVSEQHKYQLSSTCAWTKFIWVWSIIVVRDKGDRFHHNFELSLWIKELGHRGITLKITSKIQNCQTKGQNSNANLTYSWKVALSNANIKTRPRGKKPMGEYSSWLGIAWWIMEGKYFQIHDLKSYMKIIIIIIIIFQKLLHYIIIKLHIVLLLMIMSFLRHCKSFENNINNKNICYITLKMLNWVLYTH
jgi:hypothetical protein